MKHKVLLFLLCCIYINKLYAQDFTFYHYGLEDGLSQQTIRNILKDSKGFLWLGTQDGLNRFDGTTFKVFKNNRQDSLSITGNFINNILENTDQTIWIATANNGISYYHSETNTFKTPVKSGTFTYIANDNNGNIYASSIDKGLCIIKKHNNTYTLKETLFENEILSTISIIENQLYIGTKNGELITSNLDTKDFNKIEIEIPNSSIEEIKAYKEFLFIGTSTGLYTYNKITKKTNAIHLEKYYTQNTEKLFIESIKIKNNTFYIGTDNGLLILNGYNTKKQTFKKSKIFKGDKNTNGITSNRVYDILIDNDLLWVGTNKLDVVSLKPQVFQTINNKSSIRINNNHVYSIFKTDDYLFVGTRNGLNCIDNSGNVSIITKENTNEKLAYNVIRGITKDDKNNLWLATTKGISVIKLDNFNPKKPIITSIYYKENDNLSLRNNKTRGVFKDHKNDIWITTYGGGLNRFTGNLDKKAYTFQSYTKNETSNSISSDFVFSITQDKDYNYWVTSENGLNKLEFLNGDYNNPKFTIYTNNKNNLNSLQNNTVLHTHQDSENILWIATQGGLHKYNSKENIFKHYNETHGLTNNYIYNILEDKNNRLWLSTNDGIFRFNKSNESFDHYTTKDGVQSSEFNLGAHYYDKAKNTLYFGGVNGFNCFNPDSITKLDKQGRLSFISLKIRDKEINAISNTKILEKSLNNVKEIYLNHNDFPCSIQFSDLDLRPTKNNQFIYALNNSDWNNLKSAREIQILDLPKGSHSLKIQGKSRNKIWTNSPLEIIINVKPPWYKSNLAYLLYILSILVIGYLFYQLSLQRQLASQEATQLKELANLKSQFITNITHEFRTPLTLIIGYINTLKESLSENNNVKTPLKSIENNSNNLLNLVNEMLDLAKLEKGKLKLKNSNQDIIAFTKNIVNSFLSMADSKNINLQFSSNIPNLTIDIDTEKIRQIISNLIANAIKFSNENKTVNVTVKKENKLLCIEVKDEGVGIAKDEISYVFDRFYQSDKNKNDIVGTGVGLALSKELISLMGGSINVVSKENMGSTFTIKLPITSDSKQIVNTNVNLDRKILKQDESASNFIPLENNKHKYTILIVEDNVEIANYIASCLNSTYNILFAKNGQEGYEKAQKNIPDIIITDVMMPIMDGNELTKKLQETKITNHIPIIMLTAKAQFEDKLAGIKSGADVYLNKPFEKEELLLRIENLIIKRKKLQDYYKIENVVTIDRDKIAEDKNMAFLDQAVKFIHNNIDNPNLNSEKLASDLHMSESQLYRKLKAITNKSTAIFIRTVRLEKAKELLLSTNLSVSEISYATGFSNPNWFGKVFKETFGKNPTEIRQ